jgi:hypothetical protein
VAALPAGQRARRLVPAQDRGRGRADAQGDDRALARKLLVALWRFCREGVVPEGAALKAA